jgi:hypothetical protein
MTEDEFAISIGMPWPALDFVLDSIESRDTWNYIRKTCRTQFGHTLTNAQWAAAKKWYSENPRD